MSENITERIAALRESLRDEQLRKKLIERSAREAQIKRARNLGCDRIGSTKWSDDTSSSPKQPIPHSLLNPDSTTLADIIDEFMYKTPRKVHRVSRASRLLHEESTVQPEIRDSYKNLTLYSPMNETTRAKSIIDAILKGKNPLQNLLAYCSNNASKHTK